MSSNNVSLALIRAKLTPNANSCGTLSSSSAVYAYKGETKVYTASTGGSETTWPTLTVNAGYTQTGWFSTSTGTAKVLNNDGTFSGTAVSGWVTATAWNATTNKSVFAQCSTNTYTVKFTSNVASCPLNSTTFADINATYNTTINSTELTNPTCAGYTFNGWTAEGDFNSSTAKYGTTSNPSTAWVNNNKGTYFKNLSTTANGTVTLKANWTPISYKINYVYDGGTANTSCSSSTEVNKRSVNYGEEFVVCTPNNSNDYYYFGGWQATSTSNLGGSYRYYKIQHPGTSQTESTTISNSVAIDANVNIGDGAYTRMLLQNLTTTSGATITLTATWRKKNWYVNKTATNNGNQQDNHAMYTGLLSSAVSAAYSGTTIDLVAETSKDAQGNDFPSISKNVTINLNPGTQYTFLNTEGATPAAVIAVNSGYTVTIKGSGILKNDTGTSFNIQRFISNSGTTNIQGGTIDFKNRSTSNTNTFVAMNLASGTLNMSGGTITTVNTATDRALNVFYNLGTATISNGTIKETASTTHSVLVEGRTGTLTVSGGTFTGTGNSNLLRVGFYAGNQSGNVTITGGSWTKSGTQHAMVMTYGTLNIGNSSTGPTINNTGNASAIMQEAGASTSSTTLNIKNGLITSVNNTIAVNTGKCNLTGGTVKSSSTNVDISAVQIDSDTAGQATLLMSGGIIKATTAASAIRIGADSSSDRYGTATIQGGIVENHSYRPTIIMNSVEGGMVDQAGTTRVLTIRKNTSAGTCPKIRHIDADGLAGTAIKISARGFGLIDTNMGQYSATNDCYVWSSSGSVIWSYDSATGVHFKYGGTLIATAPAYNGGNAVFVGPSNGSIINAATYYTITGSPSDANTNYGGN